MELDPYHAACAQPKPSSSVNSVVKFSQYAKKKGQYPRIPYVAQERIKLKDSRIEERGELLRGWRGASFGIHRGEELERREHVRHRQPHHVPCKESARTDTTA